MMTNDYDEARVIKTTEHICGKLTAVLEDNATVKDCPAYQNGLTMTEVELAKIRALAFMVLDVTEEFFRFKSETDDVDRFNA